MRLVSIPPTGLLVLAVVVASGCSDDGSGDMDGADSGAAVDDGGTDDGASGGPTATADGMDGVCVDDAREDDDEAENGNGIEMTSAPGATFDDAVACPNDADWYTFGLAGPADLDVTLTYDATEGEMVATLYAMSGVILGNATGGDGTLQIAMPLEAGIYGVEVGLLSDAGSTSGTTYDVSLSTTP